MDTEPWTALVVERRLIEATEVLMMRPNVGGGGKSSYWPEYTLQFPHGTKLRYRPSPDALSRMEECWAWINATLPESDRKFLYGWLHFKVKRGLTVADFADSVDKNPKSIRRAVIRLCQGIADQLNQKKISWQPSDVDEVSEIPVHENTDNVAEPRQLQSTKHMIEPDAKPTHLPDSVDHKRLVKRLIRQNRKHQKGESDCPNVKS